MTAFAPLLDLLEDIADPRRAQGKRYQVQHVLLFSILAIVTGANSYRGIVTFIDVHRRLWPELVPRARAYRHPLYPSGA